MTPYQWSFPLNLPLQFFGIFPTGQYMALRCAMGAALWAVRCAMMSRALGRSTAMAWLRPLHCTRRHADQR